MDRWKEQMASLEFYIKSK